MLGNRCSCSAASLKWDKIGTGSGSIKCWALSTNGYSWQRKIAHDMVDKSFVDDFVASRHCKCESGSYASIHWGSSCVSMICSSLLLTHVALCCKKGKLNDLFFSVFGIRSVASNWRSYLGAFAIYFKLKVLPTHLWIFLNVFQMSLRPYCDLAYFVISARSYCMVCLFCGDLIRRFILRNNVDNFLAVKSLKRELWERLCNGRGNVGTRCLRGAVVELSCGIQYVSSQWKLHDISLHAWLRCINGDVVERRKFGSCGIIVGACKGCWELHWPIPVGW